MFVNGFRTIHDSKAVHCEECVYGFSVTYIVTYKDGRKERVQYLDKSIEADMPRARFFGSFKKEMK
jgi:7-cyano-7-deazaguanine synthase in queuosine biosynthesis